MSETNTTFSERIKLARDRANLTQKQLAEKVGISQTAVHKLECGRSATSRMTVQIALTCQVDPIWLATGHGEITRIGRIVPLNDQDGESTRPEEMNAEQLIVEVYRFHKIIGDLEKKIAKARENMERLNRELDKRTGRPTTPPPALSVVSNGGMTA
ncbi:MAG: helix-turn-helix transcriptional regulator [Magnetococcales bacterium]|nr:helix-turn-helix transcriptional regulator [Magnetococcales bacterium]